MNNCYLTFDLSFLFLLLLRTRLVRPRWIAPSRKKKPSYGADWPGNYFCQFEKRLPQPEIKCTRRHTTSNPLQSCLVSLSIFGALSLKTSFWVIIRTFTHPIKLFINNHTRWNTVSKGKRKMEKVGLRREGTRREKSPAFNKITREINQ